MINNDTPTSETSPPVKPRSSAASWLAVFALLIAIIALAAGGFAIDQVLRLTPTLGTLQEQQEESSRSVTKRFSELTQDNSELENIRGDIAAVQKNLAELNPTAANDALKTEIEGLKTRLVTLEKKQAEFTATHAAAFDDGDVRALRYTMLRALIDEGKPHRDALERFNDALGDGLMERAEIRSANATLAKSTTLPTRAQLIQLYVSIPSAIHTPSTRYIPQEESHSWWQNIVNSLSRLVSVEKIDASALPQTTRESARVTLIQGDISATVALLEKLPESDRAAYAHWLEEAARYEEAHAALATLRTGILDDSATDESSEE
jgi:hypothetical protein